MGLALFMEASGTLSMGLRHRAPSGEGLRSPGRKVNSESLCTPGNQPEKEKEREREREKERKRKKDMGTRSLMEQRCFIQHCVSIYTVLQGSYFQQR